MNDDIKEILKWLQNGVDMIPDYACYGIEISDKDCKLLLDYITNLQQELKYQEEAEIEYNEKYTKLMKDFKKIKEQNNDLRKIYKNTYNKLFENENDELARYFQAQIDDCPTFYVEPIVDYHKE